MSYMKGEKSVWESLHLLRSYITFYPGDSPREGNLGLVSGVFRDHFFVCSACISIRITMRKIRIQIGSFFQVIYNVQARWFTRGGQSIVSLSTEYS